MICAHLCAHSNFGLKCSGSSCPHFVPAWCSQRSALAIYEDAYRFSYNTGAKSGGENYYKYS